MVKPSSRCRIRSSRANGALARGPKTAEGKCRAAGNRVTHGLYSGRVVLKHESQQDFDNLLRQFIDDCHPETPAQTSAVTDMAIAHWSLRRVHRIETNMLNLALANVDPETTDPGDRTAAAWKQATLVPVFNKLASFEASYVTRFARGVELYSQLRQQAAQPAAKMENDHSNPLNEILTSAKPSSAYALQRRPKVSQPQPKHENHHSNPLNETFMPPGPPSTAPPDPPKPRPPSPARASSLVIVHNELRI